jgi:hypothetical protein
MKTKSVHEIGSKAARQTACAAIAWLSITTTCYAQITFEGDSTTGYPAIGTEVGQGWDSLWEKPIKNVCVTGTPAPLTVSSNVVLSLMCMTVSN